MFEAALSIKPGELEKLVYADSCDYTSYKKRELVCRFCKWFVFLKQSKNGNKFFAHFPNQPENFRRQCKYRNSVESNTENLHPGEDRGQRLEIVQAEFLKSLMAAFRKNMIGMYSKDYTENIDSIEFQVRKIIGYDKFQKIKGMVSSSLLSYKNQTRILLRQACEINQISYSERKLIHINTILSCIHASTNTPLVSNFIQYGIYQLKFDSVYKSRHKIDYGALWKAPSYPHETVAIVYDYLIYIVASVDWSHLLA